MDVRAMGQGRQLLGELQNTDVTAETHNSVDVMANKSNLKEIKNNNNEKADGKQLEKSVDKLNKLLEDQGVHLEYEIYGRFRDLTIKIIDNDTKEVIKEIPPKKIIDMVDKLCELAGVLVDKKA